MKPTLLLFFLFACSNTTKPIENEESIAVDADGDGFTEDEDCDDANSLISPAALEVCDGADNNCDGEIDEGVLSSFYADSDLDGYGNPSLSTEACEAPAGFVSNGTDCDDTQAHSYPSAEEICDGLDNNCDEEIDEGLGNIYYTDADGDGFGDANAPVEACQIQDGLTTIAEDCDDQNMFVSPLAQEICDGLDNNCDGNIDENLMMEWFADADDDGFGNPTDSLVTCEAPEGYIANDQDCDDLESFAHPEMTEVCDGIDNDCDGEIDGANSLDALSYYTDADNDGFGAIEAAQKGCFIPPNFSPITNDCDDTIPSVHPSMSEVCDGIDNNCDGIIDEAGSIGEILFFTDADNDGFGDADFSSLACAQPSGTSLVAGDCNDAEPSISSGADEICDGLDNDCDGQTDEADAIDESIWYADTDSDGYGDVTDAVFSCTAPSNYVENNADCDDTSNQIYSGAPEQCDGIDNNCDGQIDEASALTVFTWYEDGDEDGFGDPESSVESCAQPAGYVTDNTDCADNDNDVFPEAPELCNNEDDDCDGQIDNNATNAATWYEDSDSDGYGNPNSSLSSCVQPTGFVANPQDCDDISSAIHPQATETCNGSDDNCDGIIDESTASDVSIWYLDADGDGQGDLNNPEISCYASTGYVASGGDCDDDNNQVYVGAAEVCDGIDNDCNSSTVEPIGMEETCPADSCLALLQEDATLASDAYWIDPDGSGAVYTSCDMSTDGGGWTLVLHLYNSSGFQEDSFLSLFGNPLFTNYDWSFDGSLTAGISSLQSNVDQGAMAIGRFSGMWTDVRMACHTSNGSLSPSHFAQVSDYTVSNGNYKLLGSVANGTSYSVPSSSNSFNQTTIWHDNELNTINSGHYHCDYTNSGSNGTSQFGFCYTNFLNNDNSLDYGDSIVALAFGTSLGNDGWSTGFSGECGNMGTGYLNNSGTFWIWIR